MRSVGIFPVLLAGAIACRGAPEPERAAETSPYGRLEVARVEEVSPRPDSAPLRRSPRAVAPVHPSPTPPPDADEPPETAAPADTAAPPDTVGYSPYVADPPVDTAAAGVLELPSRGPERTVPAGTAIHAALEDSIDSRIDVSGKVVAARVMQNVTAPDGRTLIPAGTPVQLTVTQVKPGRGDRKGVLEIRADSITLGSHSRKLDARLQPVSHELRGRGVTGEEAAKVGVGAAGGAVVGRVIGGDTRGAVIGGVVGAAGGAVVASETAAKDVVVKARTPVVLVLNAPLPAGS